MAARRPAKIATTKKAQHTKLCPACKAKGQETLMSIMKMVRYTRPSGMYWVCSSCNHEIPTRA